MIYLKNVVTLQVNEDKCIACGMCVTVCPHAVLSMNGRSVYIENRDACMECGACARNCPSGAVTVNAGVGCATAVINSALGKKGSACCSVEQPASCTLSESVAPMESHQTNCR